MSTKRKFLCSCPTIGGNPTTIDAVDKAAAEAAFRRMVSGLKGPVLIVDPSEEVAAGPGDPQAEIQSLRSANASLTSELTEAIGNRDDALAELAEARKEAGEQVSAKDEQIALLTLERDELAKKILDKDEDLV